MGEQCEVCVDMFDAVSTLISWGKG